MACAELPYEDAVGRLATFIALESAISFPLPDFGDGIRGASWVRILTFGERVVFGPTPPMNTTDRSTVGNKSEDLRV